MPGLAHTSIAVTRDRIYVTVLAPTPRVFRMLPSGALDPSFGTGGRVDLPNAGTPPGGAVATVVDREGRLLVLWGAAWQGDGRLVVLVGRKLLRIR